MGSRVLILAVIGLLSELCRARDTVNSLNDLLFDGNNRLQTHYLLYSGAGCQSVSHVNLDLRQVSEATGDAKAVFFPNTENDAGCSMICLERGTLFDHLPFPTQMQKHHLEHGEDPMEWIMPNCQAAEFGLISYLTNDATVYWMNEDLDRVKVGEVSPGEQNTFWITSYLGHEFEVVNHANEEEVYRYFVECHSIHAIGQYESGRIERDVKTEVFHTFQSEWERAHMVKRTFTNFGFNKGKLPLDIFGSMSAYYYNNREAATVEEWESKGVFVNWWERDVFFISMPFKLKKYWQSQLKPLVEAWAGVELELTDIYGMRRYEDGARLLTHVDRVNTHACSIIINIGQSEMREPWTVEIYDFADRLHEITMDEGDIVFYESARCLHGRMQPLQGRHYVNLFAHYRPVGDPHWYLKSNPPGTPPQITDIGHCTSNGTRVTCDGPHAVPYLSPKLQTLRGAKDLYDFWVQAGETGSQKNPTTTSHEEF